MAFDLTDYLAKRDGAFEARPAGLDPQYLTTKQRDVALKTAEKQARLAADAARQVAIAETNKQSIIGKLELDPNSLIGKVADTGVATFTTAAKLVGKAATIPLNYLADSAENSVTPEQRAAVEAQPGLRLSYDEPFQYTDPSTNKTLLLNSFDGDVSVNKADAIDRYHAKGDNVIGEAAPSQEQDLVAPPLSAENSRAADRLTAAIKARELAKTIGDATNLESLTTINPETGERTSGLQGKVADGALKLASGFVGANESLVGLVSLVDGGDAAAALNEAGYDFKHTKKELAKLMTPEQRLADSKTDQAEGFSKTLDAALDNPSTITGGIIESIPSMLVGGVAGKLLTKAIPAVKAGIAAAFGEGMVMAGTQAENIRTDTEDQRLNLKQKLLAAGTGVMGAGVGAIGNKLSHALKVTDVDEALVNGALGQAQRGVLTRTGLAGAIEGGEELVQSSGEKVAQNVALDKPFDEGVGNAAAMGLVTGTPMGVASGAGQAARGAGARKDQEQTQRADFQAAVDAADPSPYLDPKTSNYAPDKAVAVLFAASQKEDATPELQAEHLSKAESIVAELEQDVSNRRADVFDTTPEGQAKLQAEIAKAEQHGQAPVVEALQQALAQVQAMTPEQKAEVQAELVKSETRLADTQQVAEQLSQLVSPKVDEVQAQVEAAQTDPVAAEKVLTLAINRPESLSQADLSSLINDTSNSLSTEQRSYLKAFDEARVARNRAQSTSSVNQEVLQGTDENMGLAQYHSKVTQALRQGQDTQASQLLEQLSSFAQGHKNKFRVATAALKMANRTGQPVQIVRTESGWQKAKQTYSPEELRAIGFEVRPGKFSLPTLHSMQDEAKAIAATYTELKAAQGVALELAQRRGRRLPSGQTESTGAPAISETAPATETPVSTPATTEAPAAEAPAEVTEPTPAAEVTTGLDVFQGERAAKVDAQNYKGLNLVRQFLTQSKDRTVSGLNRPLVAVKNFLNQTEHSLKDFAPDSTLTSKQEEVLNDFKTSAETWNGLYDALLPNKDKIDPQYSHLNPIEFFMNDDGQLEENVKTAISASVYGWLNEHARDLVGSPQHIARLMHWDKDKRLNAAIHEAVGHLGTRESVVANDLGQSILQALGIKALDTAGANEKARIEAGLGQYAIAFMLDQKLVERQAISKGELVKLGAKKASNADWDEADREAAAADATLEYFLRVQSTDPTIQAVVELNTGSQGILDKVFGLGRAVSEPSRTPPVFAQETTKHTQQPIPQSLRSKLEYLIQQPWRPVADRVNLLLSLPDALVDRMIGVKPVNEQTVHKDNRPGLTAKNNALLRDKQNAFAFLRQLSSEEQGLEQDLYMEYSVWKHHRVGMTGNVLNPQTSKVQRFLVGMTAWDSVIHPQRLRESQEFLLQVAAGLDIPIDKQSKKASLAALKTLLASDVMQEGMGALSQALAGHPLQDFEQKAIAAAVEAGNMDLHSFAALLEMVKYDQAKANGTTFTSQLMGEVDGVTNGPMLSQILFGTITQEIAHKGGFYGAESGFTDYPTWRGEQGHQDFYETLASRLRDNLKASFDLDTLTPIFAFTGDLLVKVNRKIVKRPLTAVNYGSGLAAAIEGMADDFIGKVYEQFEELAKGKDPVLAQQQVQALLEQLNTMLVASGKSPMVTTSSLQDVMNSVLPSSVETTLKQYFTATVGEAMKTALTDTLGDFLTARDQFNRAGRIAFGLYDAVYQHMKASYIAQNLDGTLASTTRNGQTVAAQDLSAEQDAVIRKRLAKMEPLLASAISHQDGDRSTGIRLADTSKTLSDSPAYTGQVKLQRVVPGALNSRNPNVKTMRFRAFEQTQTSPGVASLVFGVQSTDSAIISSVYGQQPILNVHDAGGSGINGIGQMAEALNQSTFDNLLNYSPPSAMLDTLTRVVTGLAEVMQDNQDTELPKAVQKVLDQEKVANLEGLLTDTLQEAFRANTAKLEFLGQQAHISQYGLAEHSYRVTETDLAKVAEVKAKLRSDLPSAVKTRVKALDSVLNRKQTEAAEAKPAEPNGWGELGRPAQTPNMALVEFFSEEPQRQVGELLGVLESVLGTDLQGQYLRKLLKLIGRTVDLSIPVTYVTKDTPMDGQDLSQLGRAMAWYSSDRGIFILSSDFSNSQLDAEPLLHELVHASVALEMENPSTSEAHAMVQELEQLREWTKAKVGKDSPYADALVNVHELVAYGLTNKAVQELLRQVQVPTKGTGNRFINGMQRFINAISGLLFKDSRLSQSEQAINGLTILIENASGLFAASKAAQPAQPALTLPINSTDPLARIQQLSTQQLFDLLSPAAPSFQVHLRKVQQQIANKLHGPFSSIKDALSAEQALTPDERFLKAVASGRLPFASAAQVNGVAMSAQEAFLFEQVEAVTLASIDNTGVTSVAYRELGKLYDEVKAKITPADIGQAAYDFIFTIQTGANGKSDYLARFVAAGLAYQPLADKLAFSTKTDTRSLKGMTFWQAVQTWFERLLETFHSKLTHTQPGQLADAKLMTLIEQLVDIESKRRTALAAPPSGFSEIIEVQTRRLNDAVRKGVQGAVDSKFFKENKLSGVRAMSAVASTVFGDRLELFVEGMQRLRDQQFKQSPGIVMGLFNEIRGSHAGNLTAHELLRGTNNNERLRKHLIDDSRQLALGSFANQGQDLSTEDKAAITHSLRVDLQSLLDSFTVEQIEQLLSDPKALNQAIEPHQQRLQDLPHYRYYLRGAKDLAFFMATGKVRSPNLVKNAYALARLFGTEQSPPSAAQAQQAEAVLNPLISLMGLRYSPATTLKRLAEVFRTENARGNDSGMQFTLRMHRLLQEQAKERLFDGSEGLMIKGYVPEVFNPRITVKAATVEDGKQLLRMGYAKSDKPLAQDMADPYAEEMHLYRLEDGGLKAYVTGIFSTTGLNAKGNTVHGGEYDLQGQQLHAINQRHSAMIARKKAAAIRQLFTSDERYEPTAQVDNHLVPVFNPQGKAVNYAYLMAHVTKDVLLERNNNFDELLGQFAGSTFDKQSSAEQNAKAVKAFHDQYLGEYAQRSDSYLVVGPGAKEERLREAYKLLPKATQQEIIKVWGSPNMLIRSDLVDMALGYRKFSISDMFHKQAKDGAEPGKAIRTAAEQVFVDFWSFVMANRKPGSAPYQTLEGRKAAEARAALKLRQAEDVWQEIVSEIKDILVVKTGMTLIGNVLSNFTELYWIGVPLTDMVKHHRIALRGVVAYRKDAKELFQLQQLLATNTLKGSLSDMQQRIAQLEDAIARNPVKELIDAGLLPTIVEDVSQDVDAYSYKSKLVKGTERFTNGLNKHVKTAGKTLYMAHDTQMYQWLSQGTQISDFLARYTTYQHMTGRKTAPMDHKTAVQFVSDAFVNYDIPTHRTMQYLNDMGIIRFTKYYLRIQTVIMHLWRDNPARALMLLSLDHFFSGAQTLMDSGFLHHLGNPLNAGALEYPFVLDELATTSALLSPLK